MFIFGVCTTISPKQTFKRTFVYTYLRFFLSVRVWLVSDQVLGKDPKTQDPVFVINTLVNRACVINTNGLGMSNRDLVRTTLDNFD